MVNPAHERVNQKLEEIQEDFGKKIVDLLRETNKVKLEGTGKTTAKPKVDRNSLRWTLAWQEGLISYDLNVIVNVEDDGKVAQVNKVLVHRHASADYDYDGHTPTTRMRRLTGLSLKDIKEAIDAEFK